MQGSHEATIISEILVELIGLLDGIVEKYFRKAESQGQQEVWLLIRASRITCQFVCAR